MRPFLFSRSTANVFLALLFSAVCQFVYRVKALLYSLRFFGRQRLLSTTTSINRQWLTSMLPSLKTLGIYLLTFGLVLPLLAMNINYTMYQQLFDASRYTANSAVLRRIVRGPNLTERIVEENTNRLKKAIDVLDRLTMDYRDVVNELRSRSFKDVTIGIITYSRDKYRESNDGDPRQYLTQLTASLIDKYQQYRSVKIHKPLFAPFRERTLSVGLLLCDVDEDPDNNQEFRWLVNRVKVGGVSRKNEEKYMNSCDDPERKVTGMGPWGPFERNSRFEKQKQDYTYCLRFFQRQMMTRYMLVLEDDVLPTKDFFFKLDEIIINRLDRNEYGSDKAYSHNNYFGARPNVFMVKLHHPEVFLGYPSLQLERLPQLYAISALAAFCLLVLQRFASLLWVLWSSSVGETNKRSKPNSPEPDTWNQQEDSSIRLRFASPSSACYFLAEQMFTVDLDWLCFFKCFVYFALVFLALGRPNTYIPFLASWQFPFSSVPSYLTTLIPAPSCCITAVLYPRDSVSEVVNFFEKNRCVQNAEARDDMLFGQLSETHPLPSLLAEPNLFYHIGRYSSIRGRVNHNDDREWTGIPF